MRIEIMINKEQKISPETLSALEAELYKNFLPIYPDTSIRIRKGSANGVVLSGVRQDDDKKNVMDILQAVWEDDSWQYQH
ncbi:DNA-damage-inducible protein DinI [Pantoea agglomerans Tx10]|uniref:DinI-like family protein n=1 Tax=Enterobacter agglomerans TaxID=549 RepID=UPI0003B23AA9|nr:DinI-like family protein [Pantoea agglomerans]ERM10883.1 DNA-damage-inducible protein DinI [Pantoea agglomerans Tx10]